VGGSGGIAPLTLSVGFRYRRTVIFLPNRFLPHPRTKRAWNALNGRLGEFQSRHGRSEEEINFKSVPGIETDFFVVQYVA
jgi:hypothetical protein